MYRSSQLVNSYTISEQLCHKALLVSHIMTTHLFILAVISDVNIRET